MISGSVIQNSQNKNRANPNKAYFSNRQDRYLHFSAQPAFADYCFSFLQTVSGFSYQVLATSSGPALHWEDASVLPWQIQSKAERALSQFQLNYLLSSVSSTSSEEQANLSDVVIFPVIQAGVDGEDAPDILPVVFSRTLYSHYISWYVL
jgi:CDP-diacylglycerol--glycerol-3-phosphate 3-phosphatidyltransferase